MEGLNRVEKESVCARGFENSESLFKETKKDNQGNINPDVKSVGEIKTELAVINKLKLGSAEDEQTRRKLNKSKNESGPNLMNNGYSDELNVKEYFANESLLTVSQSGKIFPQIDEENQNINKILELSPHLLEHNYSKFGKSVVKPFKFRIQKSTYLNAHSENTFIFENESELGKKRMEEQTIVAGSSTTNHVDSDSDSDLSEVSPIKPILGYKSEKKNKKKKLYRTANGTNTQEPNQVKKFSTPKIRIRKSSIGNTEYYDIVVCESGSMPPPLLPPKPESSEGKKLKTDKSQTDKSETNKSETKKSETKKRKSQNRISDSKAKRKLELFKKAVDSGGITYKVAEMEIIHAKSEAFGNSGEKNMENMGQKNEVAPLKLRKVISKDISESQKAEQYVVSNSNSNQTETVPQDKNWNLEYTEEDAKNLQLDDLLVRASEVNAENFTKALGQNSGGRNGNKADSPDVLLSFPTAKRQSDVPIDGDDSKGGSVKRAKLEIIKKCVSDDKTVKPTEEESLKKVPELPRRPGLKVKTVENINEEFKDSLGAKMKKLDTQGLAPESSIPVFTINDDSEICDQTEEVFVPNARNKVPKMQSARLSCRKVNQQQEPSKIINEEARPFIMTIIPNKDKTAKNRLPPGLTPKIFVKPRSVCSQRGNILPTIKERPSDAAVNKTHQGANSASKSAGSVTLVASEPKSFEVINIEENSDPGVKKIGKNSHFVLNYGSLTKKDFNGKNVIHASVNNGSKKKNIPILLSTNKKYLQMPLANSQKLLISPAEDPNKQMKSGSHVQNRVVNSSSEGAPNIQGGNSSGEKARFTVSSIEPRVIMKDPGSGPGGGKYVQVIPNIVSARNIQAARNSSQRERPNPEIQKFQASPQREQMMSLSAFANLLKDILPEKWILAMDKKYGLQILKTHLDEHLNPSITVSVVIGRMGKVTVNVRGRQLERSHELFANLCDVGNSKGKVSINYILAIINKLRFYNVCFGCDDLSLKKYWSEDGFIEYYTEFQQTYRSHICDSLVRLGRKRCHSCYRMHESLKKRRRREELAKKTGSDSNAKSTENVVVANYSMTSNSQLKAARRNTEEALEDTFTQMKQRIMDEIERAKEEEENEKVPKTQDEVLGFMGLTRKDSLDVNVRKSKREKKGFKKFEPLLKTPANKEELYFLEKYWDEIYVLFSTSLLVGAYSRTSIGKLKDKCKTFYRLLATWTGIVQDNAICVGGHFNLGENIMNEEDVGDLESVMEKFDRMDITTLRSYTINCVKEVNRMKNRLKTKNRYFRVLYNTFLKPNTKRARQTNESVGSSNANVDLVAEKDVAQAQEESTPEKVAELKLSTSTEAESSDENSHRSSGAAPSASEGD